jgi:hypothetical protein
MMMEQRGAEVWSGSFSKKIQILQSRRTVTRQKSFFILRTEKLYNKSAFWSALLPLVQIPPFSIHAGAHG